MLVAVLSDIHANAEALSAVDSRLGIVDQVFVLGDVVGYGANPETCLGWVIQKSTSCLMGNHDAACIGVLSLDWFNPQARQAVEWTRQRLSSPMKTFLGSLPRHSCRWGAQWVHGSPDNPLEEYIANQSVAHRLLSNSSFFICFYGHTHVAEVYILESDRLIHRRLDQGGEIHLEDNKRYLINCGSVGQPRDGNHRASFGLFDPDRKVVRVIRVEYDRQQAADKILQAGLPGILAYRLSEGR